MWPWSVFADNKLELRCRTFMFALPDSQAGKCSLSRIFIHFPFFAPPPTEPPQPDLIVLTIKFSVGVYINSPTIII